MVFYVLYDATGNILRVGTCAPDDIQYQAGPGETVLITNETDIKDTTHYHDGNGIVSRGDSGITVDKISIEANGVEVATFSSIPVGTMVGGVIVNDGVLEYTTNSLGMNRLVFVNNPGYKVFKAEILGT